MLTYITQCGLSHKVTRKGLTDLSHLVKTGQKMIPGRLDLHGPNPYSSLWIRQTRLFYMPMRLPSLHLLTIQGRFILSVVMIMPCCQVKP